MDVSLLQTVYLYNRQNEVPVLTSRAGKVEANHYNHVQTAIKRIGPELRFRIPKLKHLDLILQKDAWVVVDRALSDYPILCWTDFKTQHRDNLHEPIICEIRIFHFAATMILKKTINAMELLLGEELSAGDIDQLASVTSIKKNRKK